MNRMKFTRRMLCAALMVPLVNSAWGQPRAFPRLDVGDDL